MANLIPIVAILGFWLTMIALLLSPVLVAAIAFSKFPGRPQACKAPAVAAPDGEKR
jgi:hypothetical protein